ncbi:YeeE/YedE thiosulfate transporter family protein [Yeosuana sp. AK3]
MGPLIPNGLIPMEWDSIIAIIIGIAFGFVLEASGFSSSRKLAGVFYGYDFAVLKVFFTAAAVSVIGIYYMDYLGYLDINQLYVHPTYLWAAIIGGIIMGLGFVAGGFCPGTSLCAVAIGKLDAWVYVGGIMIGVFVFSELYSFFEPIYNGYFLGNITLVDSFGWNPYWVIFIFSIIAIVAFVVSDVVRKKVKKVFYS